MHRNHPEVSQPLRPLVIILAVLIGFSALFCPGPGLAGTIHVKASATGAATGAGWADAHTSLQNAFAKNIKIEQFNNNGSANGVRTVPLGPNATYVYEPKDLVTDGTAQFRGSVRVTGTNGGRITGAIKYDLHQRATATTPVDAMTLYRSMGQ